METEAYLVNEKVEEYKNKPRIRKRSLDEAAHRIIKRLKDTPVSEKEYWEEERPWYKNLYSCGIRITKAGFMEVSRWEEADQGKRRRWQRIDGVNSALRMQDHILGKYRSDEQPKPGEFSHLESIEEVIEAANGFLLEWDKAKSEEKKDLQKKLVEVVLQLEKCRNAHKLKVKERSAAVSVMKDRLQRDNPSALAARTVGALNSLAKRMDEMRLIMPIIAMRKEALILEKKRINHVFHKASLRIIEVMAHEVFKCHSPKPAQEKIRDNEARILDKKIGQALHLLSTIRALPYSQKAQQAAFRLRTRVKIFIQSKMSLIDNAGAVHESLLEALSIIDADIENIG